VSVTGTGQLGQSQSGIGLAGQHTAATGVSPGVQGTTSSNDPAGAGVVGKNTGSGPGLRAIVNAGAPPLAVNSDAKVTGLNADKLDGKDSAEFAPNASLTWTAVSGHTTCTTCFGNPTPGKFTCRIGNSEPYYNCWANKGSPASAAAFAKDPFGIVHLKGQVRCIDDVGDPTCTSAGGNEIFVLPDGYKPAEETIFGTASNGAFGLVRVSQGGSVLADVGTPSGYFSLDGLTFPAG